MAEDFTIDRFVDALGQLPEYGGHEALASGLREAYPDVTFQAPGADNDYSAGIQTYDWDPSFSKQGTPSFLGQGFRLDNTALQKSAQPHFLSAYEAMWPTLSGLVNPSTSPALTGSMLSSGSSPAGGAITTTSGGISGTDPFAPPTSTSLTDPMPSQEEVNNTSYKDWVNKTVGKNIFDLEDNNVKVDSSQINVEDRIPSLANSSVDELIATATSERTPYTSQVPNSANKYLQGGPNAFAYSGEGGYAAERQRMLGRAPDIYQGPEVPWQRLGKDARSDVYYGNQRFNAPTGEVADVGGGEEFDWNAWRDKMRAGTIAERVEIDTDNIFTKIKDNYGDLADDRLADIMEDVKEYWPGLAGTGVDLSNIKTTEDLYNNPIVQKNVSEGFGKIKSIFTKTGEGVKKGAEILNGVVDELTRITERKGGRGSVTDGDPSGLSATGLAEGLLGILTLDFDGKRLDRQEYGNLQPAAIIAAALVPGLLPVQLANELKDFIKDAINVSTFADPEYKAGGSFANAKNNTTEFAGSILRPFVQTIAKVIGGKTTDASLKDLLKKSDLENIKTGEPWRTDFKGFKLFPEKVEDEIRGGTDAQLDPTDRGPVPETTPPSEIDTSTLIDEVLNNTVTETGDNENFRGQSQSQGSVVTAPIVDVTIPEEQETVNEVSDPNDLSMRTSDRPPQWMIDTFPNVFNPDGTEKHYDGINKVHPLAPKEVSSNVPAPEPTVETDSLGDQGVDIKPDPKIEDIPTADISTIDLIEMINPVTDAPTTVGPDYTGQGVSAGESTPPVTNLFSGSLTDVTPPEPDPVDFTPTLDDPVIKKTRVKKYPTGTMTGEAVNQPATDPFTSITGDKEEYKGAYTDITYPVDKNGDPYRGNDVSEIARWKTTPVGTTDYNQITDIFGKDVSEAYAKYGEGSKDNDSWKGQGNKPLDLRNADLQKQKEEWTTQKQEGLNKEFIDNAIGSYVDEFYAGDDNKLFAGGKSFGSFKGGTLGDYKEWAKGYMGNKANKHFGDSATPTLDLYKWLSDNANIPSTKANKQKLKELFSDTIKDFAKQNVVLNIEADSIEEALDVDYIKMLDNMGIELSGLRNVGGDDSSSGGRPNIYIEPLEKAIDEQFTADTLENKLLSNLIDANDFLNSPPEHQQALIDQYRKDKNEEAAKALEQLLTEDKPDIDAASEFFAENASDRVLQKWLGFRDDIDELNVKIGDLIDEKDWDWGD